MKRKELFWRVALLFLPLAVFGVFVIWPLLDTFYYSFTDWNGFSRDFRFVGLDNFAGVVTDRLFTNATVNTLIWTALAIVLPTLGGLTLALMLDAQVPGGNAFKSIFYLPICLAAVVVGQIWIWIYQPDWGLLNAGIEAVTGAPPAFAWLAEPETALYSVIVAWSWQQMGLAMVIFLAGLTSIPSYLLEAAEIEGASRRQRIRYVVLALLRPATVVAVALSGDQLAEGVRHPVHHDRRRAVPLLRHAGDVHVQRVVQEIPDRLRQLDLGDSVSDDPERDHRVLPPAQEAGRAV